MEQNENLNPSQIAQNAIECHTCGEILVSINRHDFFKCVCGNAVDGGLDYIRRIGDPETMSDLVIFTDELESPISRDKLVWGTRGINGSLPMQYKRLVDLETSHLQAILKTQINAKPHILEAIKEILDNERLPI